MVQKITLKKTVQPAQQHLHFGILKEKPNETFVDSVIVWIQQNRDLGKETPTN